MNQPLRLVALAFATFFAASAARADVKLPAVISPHMVLQREQPVPIWGDATPGEKVTVKFRTQEKSTTADAKGKWLIKLDPLAAGGPGKLTIIGTKTIEIDDVLVGEVWVGSGQSNMQMGVRWYINNDPQLAAHLAAAPYPQIRQMQANGLWKIADDKNIREFSALLFSFGLRLHKELNVPVGLMLGAVSGSPSGYWVSQDAVNADAACQEEIKKYAASGRYEADMKKYELDLEMWKKAAAKAKEDKKPEPVKPRMPVKPGEGYANKVGAHYETYIRPLQPYRIRGVLWDQGESGTALIGVNNQYVLMGALIRGWRNEWGQGEFPFIYVPKPCGTGCAYDPTNPLTKTAEAFAPLPMNVNNPTEGLDVYLRLRNYPNTGMVICSDLGAIDAQHPRNKSGYGHRAADVALGMVYKKPIEYSGPVYESHKVEGNTMRITFTHVGKGLAFKHGDHLQGFAISGPEKFFLWADAVIEGNTVVVSHPKVAAPTSVRYGWARNHPWANFFNKDGLPAVPFRTDQWQ